MKASRKTSALHRCILETLESRRLMAGGTLSNLLAPPTLKFETVNRAGTLDESFSQDGKTTFPFLNGGIEAASDVAVQSDGKIVVVGTTQIDVVGDDIFEFAVARFNRDGTPDRTFGQFRTGKQTIDIGSQDDARATSVAIQPDGKIVVAGFAFTGSNFFDTDFAVARLNADGTPDRSFDGDGERTIDVGDNFSVARDVLIQRDGKIVVVGETQDTGLFSDNDFNFAVARLNRDGSLDGSFDDDGRRQVGFGAQDFAEAVTIDNNNKIIIVGSSGGTEFGTTASFDSARRQIAITRLNISGTVDRTFGAAGDGTVLTAVSQRPYSRARAVVVQRGGKIVVAGSTGDNMIANGLDFAMVRFLENGRIDTTFGSNQNGLQQMNFGGRDQAFGLVNSAGGGLVAAGITNGKFALAGLTVDGAPDNTFGQLGKVVTDFGTAGLAGSVGLAAGPRRLVVAGGSLFKTARYLDVAPTVGLFFGDQVATESASDRSALFVVTREAPQPFATRVFFEISGEAQIGIDYTSDLSLISPTNTRTTTAGSNSLIAPITPTRGFIDIPPRETVGVIRVNILDDNLLENRETVGLTLVPNAEYEIDSNAAGRTAVIFDDEEVRINFQASSNVLAGNGYLADLGLAFGDQGGGLRYGWDADNTANMRIRNNVGSPDFRYDSLALLQKNGANRSWEISVPAGLYEVHLVAGDPNFTDSAYSFNLEGTQVLSGTPANNVRWFERTVVVAVSDGRLTLSNGAGAVNNKIAYIDIKPAGLGATQGPITGVVPVSLKPLPPVFRPPSETIFSQIRI